MRDSSITGKDRLKHIHKAIVEIETFTKGATRESFLADHILINATLFQFATIGEAIIHIDNEILAKYDYPWYKVRGFRNFILHEYHAIEFRIVWEAINKDLPGLKRKIEQILANEFPI
jgi:uncharacterized protein with HEPN domain